MIPAIAFAAEYMIMRPSIIMPIVGGIVSGRHAATHPATAHAAAHATHAHTTHAAHATHHAAAHAAHTTAHAAHAAHAAAHAAHAAELAGGALGDDSWGQNDAKLLLGLFVTETVMRPSPRPEASTPTSPWLMASSRLYVGMFSSSVGRLLGRGNGPCLGLGFGLGIVGGYPTQ